MDQLLILPVLDLIFPDNPGYISSKGGLRSLTKALAEDLSAKEIRVNNIAPGLSEQI